MTERTAAEVTEAYCKQIAEAVKSGNDYLAAELLKEYGAKAYNQGPSASSRTGRKAGLDHAFITHA